MERRRIEVADEPATEKGDLMALHVVLLLGATAQDQITTGDEGLPLCAAACWNHTEVVRILLAAGADPVRREDGGRGRNAVAWAGIGGHLGALELLRAAIASR